MKTYYRVEGRKKGKGESWAYYSKHKTIKKAQEEIANEKKADKKVFLKGYRYRIVKVTEEVIK